MIGRLALLALVAALLSACGPDRIDLPGTMAISGQFDADQSETILAAIAQWREATMGKADLTEHIGADGDLVIYPTTDGDDMGVTTIEQAGSAFIKVNLGEIAKAHRYQAYRGVSARDALLDTTLHEMGHAFGLTHASAGLMVAQGYGGGCIDLNSVKRFCENYECPAGVHSTCN